LSETHKSTPVPDSRAGYAARFVRWVVANPVPAVSVVGGVAFVAIRAGVALFYRQFGVVPEDVGLGYQDVLIRALPVLVFALVFVGSMYVVQELHVKRHGLVLLLIGSVGTVVLLTYGLLVRHSIDLALDRVDSGHSTRIGWFDNPLGIRAEAVQIGWIGNDEPEALERCACKLVYLGQSAGTVVLYDATNDRTLRLPAARVVLIGSAREPETHGA